uniref:Reverse transcriptase domain-containing protein n=1 Tax=Anolis carolinensis TaxID=28377 RepID=A0A803U0C0_ANOCA
MVAMTTMGLSQVISGPTHQAGHTLDLVFIVDGGTVRVEEQNILPLSWSDHHLICVSFAMSSNLRRGGGPTKMVRPRRLMDPDGLLRSLGDLSVLETGDPVDVLADRYNSELARALDMVAPERPLSLRRATSTPWFTEELAVMKRTRRGLECIWRKSRDVSNQARAKAAIKAYSVALRAARKAFTTARIASAANRPTELFRVVGELLRPPEAQGLNDDLAARCSDFAHHFAGKVAQIRRDLDSSLIVAPAEVTEVPVCSILWDSFRLVLHDDVEGILGSVRATTCALDPCPSWLVKLAKEGLLDWFVAIINASLCQGSVPSCFKQAVVKPLLKKSSLDPSVCNNYRPISNLPFLGKVLERVVAKHLQGFLDDTDFLDRSQSGFRPGHSTETALVALVDDLRRELDRGSVTLLVLLDISAAFDTIDHGILLGRLSGMGLGGTVLQWLRSFLEGRSQMVKLGDTCSDPWPLTCGVPQGSILSPMLFNIYMKPLGEVIRSFGGRCHLYADDTQIHYSFPSDSKEAPRMLNQCLAAVADWMRRNMLRINPDKTEALLVSRSSDQGIGWQPVLDGVALPLKSQVRSLGVLLDSALTLEAQVSAVAGRAFAQLKLVRQLRPYLVKSDLTRVVHALVTSRLDYCNALYVGLPLKTARKLQLVQRSAARLITGASFRERSTPLFKELHWLPFIFRSQFKVQTIIYKALNGLGPAYLRDRISYYKPARALRSSEEALLSPLPLSQARLVGTRERAFSAVAPRLWNSLPIEIRLAPTLLAFRKVLKTWLFRCAFGE